MKTFEQNLSGPVVREGSPGGCWQTMGEKICGKGECWAWNEMECVVRHRSYSETNTTHPVRTQNTVVRLWQTVGCVQTTLGCDL